MAAGEATISAYDFPPSPFSSAHATIATSSSAISAVQKFRSAPCTRMLETYGHTALNCPSTSAGAMYLPPEVLIRSFLRSVMRR